MSEAHNIINEHEIDDPADDVRKAIEDLKIETPKEALIVIDKSSAVPRDDKGKFVERPKEAEPEKKPREVLTLPDKKPVEMPDPAAAQHQTPAPIKFDAPTSWQATIRPKFNELPPDVQAEIIRREQDIVKGLSKQDDERSFGRKVNEIVSPYLPVIRAEGGTPEKAIGDLLQTAHTLRQGTPMQKAGMVANVMRQFQVDPNVLLSILQGGNGTSGSPQQPGAAYNPIIETLQQRLDRMERQQQEEVQQRQLQEQASFQSQIAEFSSKPGHEHFEKVRETMGILMQNGRANTMDEAYEMAVYADPEIRTSLIASKVSEAEGKRIADQTAKTSAARNAAGSITGAPGGTKKLNGSANPTSSIEDDIRASIRDLSGRV
jgi:hypothetical protein